MDEYHLGQVALDAMRPLIAVEAGQHEFEEVRKAMQTFQTGVEVLSAWKRSAGVAGECSFNDGDFTHT